MILNISIIGEIKWIAHRKVLLYMKKKRKNRSRFKDSSKKQGRFKYFLYTRGC